MLQSIKIRFVVINKIASLESKVKLSQSILVSLTCSAFICREREHRVIPLVRSLKPRSVIEIDSVDLSPHGKNEKTHIYVVANLFTKLTYLSSGINISARNLAAVVWAC